MSRQFRSDDTDKWKDGFGNGSDGDLVISSNTNYDGANAGCSGSLGGSSLTIDNASSFANGDLVLIHQSRGTGAGNWELNKIASGGGTTSLTLAYPLQNTYIDSGASQAQIVEMKQYNNVTIDSGFSWSAPNWDGNKGGWIAFFCKGTFKNNGIVNLTSKGFRGGAGSNSNWANQGEGSPGPGSALTGANGNGGGGTTPGNGGGGGGGGFGTAGQTASSGSAAGVGGSTDGNADLTDYPFAGAGGGGNDASYSSGTNAGGNLLVIAKNFDNVDGQINSLGTKSAAANASGGAGAGGGALIKSVDVNIGNDKFDLRGGAQGSGGYSLGGAGGKGRINIDYSRSLTGSLSSTYYGSYNTRLDPTIKAGGSLGNFFAVF